MIGKQVLMVEGPDDEHVVKHICGQRQLGTIQKIQPYGGKAPLIDGIAVRLKESDIQALGIILDADTDLQARWQAVSHRLRSAGYAAVPDRPDPAGTVISSPPASLLPRVGVWLMPDNKVPGILEDFIRFLVPQDDPLLAHAESSITRIPAECRRFDELKKSKVLIHTWLSWQEEPGKPLGQAISARYLDAGAAPVDIFAQWLSRTFFA